MIREDKKLFICIFGIIMDISIARLRTVTKFKPHVNKIHTEGIVTRDSDLGLNLDLMAKRSNND